MIIMIIILLVAIGLSVPVAAVNDWWGYDYKWHREFGCPVDHRIFWGVGSVCPTHGVQLEVWTVRRMPGGAIEIRSESPWPERHVIIHPQESQS